MFSSVINCNGHFSNRVIVPAPQFPHFFLFKTVPTLLRFPVIPPSKSTLAPELCQPFFFESAANAVMKKESTLVISKLLSLIFGLTGLQRFLQGKKLALQITYRFSPAVKIFRKSTGKSASFESLTIKFPAELIL